MKINLISLLLIINIPNNVFSQNRKSKIKVYLPGTFHFAQTDSAYDVIMKRIRKAFYIKIYSKMIAQLDYSEKAIFLIIGNGHIPIIRHLFASKPYFNVIDTETWLGKTSIK